MWLGFLEPSPQSLARVIFKTLGIPGQLGYILNSKGPGIRCPISKHRDMARALLDDNTKKGQKEYQDLILRAYGTQWELLNVPVDMSAAAVQACVKGLLEGGDVLATARALGEFGVNIERDDAGTWRVWGVGVGAMRRWLREAPVLAVVTLTVDSW